MKRAILVACAIACAPAGATVVGEWRVNLLKSGSTQQTVTGKTQDAAWLTCQALIPQSGSAQYTCQTPRYVATVTPTPAPTPTPTPTPTPVPTPTPTPTPTPAPPPVPTGVYFGDLSKGPAGAPLTICGGKIDSVSIGGAIAPIAARDSAIAGLCVRVVPTKSGSIDINGQASGLTYTVTAGSVLYVSPTGNDSTAAKNDPSKPWRRLQGSSDERSGALGAYSPGDVIVLRGGNYSDAGYQKGWARLLSRGDVAIVSYPGEQVVYSGNPSGGIQGPDGAHAGQAPRVTISSLKIVGGGSNSLSDGCPINLQNGADGWRIVNNDLSWPSAPAGMKCAGVAGHGADVAILGNYIHDIAGGQENHGIYIDGGDGKSGPYEIRFNAVARVTGGNLVQTYDCCSGGVSRFTIADNDLRDGGRYGINLSENTPAAASLITRNTITNTVYSAIRLNTYTTAATDLAITANVMTNVNTKGGNGVEGAINCDSTAKLGKVTITGNTIVPGKGATDGIYSEYGTCPAVKFQ